MISQGPQHHSSRTTLSIQKWPVLQKKTAVSCLHVRFNVIRSICLDIFAKKRVGPGHVYSWRWWGCCSYRSPSIAYILAASLKSLAIYKGEKIHTKAWTLHACSWATFVCGSQKPSEPFFVSSLIAPERFDWGQRTHVHHHKCRAHPPTKPLWKYGLLPLLF